MSWRPVAPSLRSRMNIYCPSRKIVVCFLFLVLALAACQRSSRRSSGVELLVHPDPISSDSTFELRFDEIIARPEQVGVRAAKSPLVISPSLAGSFTWLSQRSGVFTPTAPLAMEVRYDLSLQSGLLTADGKPASARLRESAQTPGLALVHESFPGERTNLPCKPEVNLMFNVEVRA